MAFGKRRRERQLETFVAATDLPKSSGNPFYTALNRLLAENDFDHFVEKLCGPRYAKAMGRPRSTGGVPSDAISLATSRGSSRTAVSAGGALTADRWRRSWG